MARGFNLTAEINLRGPANIRTVVADIRRQLGTITANVDVRINPGTARNVTVLNQALGRLNTTLSQTNVLASQVSAALNNLATAGTSAGTSLRNIPTIVRNAATAVNQFNTNVNRTTSTLAQSRTEFEEFGRQSALAIRRFAAFATVTGVIFKVNNAISSAFSEFIAFDKELVRVAQVTDSSVKSLASLQNRITNLSTSFGVASKDLIQISSTLAQAGLSAKDTEKALKALALSALAPSFDSLSDTVEGSIALMRQFGISAGDLEQALGSVNSVAAKFAVEASDIIAAIQRTGGVFAAASRGVSEGKDALNEFIAVFTSVRATTRESAETIATGLRTIFTRIQRSSTIDALKEFGVNLTDVEGKFVGAYKAVELLSGGLSRIDPRDLRFSKIVEELGGFRQIGKVIPLIQEFTTAQQALAVAQKGQGSLAADASTAQQALAVKISKVREEFIGLIRSVSQSDSFQTFINLSLDLTSSLVQLADSAKVLLPALTAIAAIRGGSFLTQFATGFAGGLRRQNAGGGAIRGFAVGGQIRRYKAGGNVEMPVALTPGEAVFYPEQAAELGPATLRIMNRADQNGYRQKRARGGGIGIVPGRGNTDSFYTTLPVGSFVIRKAATQALGLDGNSRQKFAQGGLAQLKSSRPYVKNIDTTFDKEPNQSIKKGVGRAKEPLRFNLKDSIQANIIREPITLTEQNLEDPRIKPQNKKNYLDPNPRIRGYGFEEILSDLGKYKKETINKFSRVDGYEARGPVEVRSRDKQTSTNVLLNKLMGSILGEGSEAERLVAQKASGVKLNKNPNIIDAGNLIVFEDTLPLTKKYRTQEEFDKNKTKKRVRNRRPALVQAQAFNEDVQQLMAGEYVKSRAGRKTRDILSDITMADVAKYPASKIIGELGAAEVDKILASAGVFGIPANKFLRQYKLDPAQQKAKQLVASRYVERINAKAAANRAGSSKATTSATSRGTLFGAIGMFGSPFPPEDLQITTDPEKPPVTVRAFGAVLDKNKAAKNARLQEREQRLQGINAKRVLRGKSELLDTRAIDIKGAPTAAGLSKQYLKEDLSGVTKRTNQTIINSVLNALSGGSGTKAFFDFDKTLAFRTNPLGYKEEKLKKGQKPKNPDYTAFGDMSKVEKGLLKAKPSMLLLKLAKLVSTTRKKMPDQLGTLLSNMSVVTARPQNTIGAIGSWLASKGVPVPLNNIRGVGGTGMSSKDVAVAKANTILEMAGSSSSLFVDDDATNIAAAQQAGIRSYSYGAKLPLSKAVKKSIADSQGSKFQNDITANLAQTPEGKRLLTAMENDTQQRSIDFPYGIGSNLATNWFNNPLLARIPVDAKRTLTGPRGKISDNIKNFLKARGFAGGGFVEHGGIRYSNDDVAKIASKLGLSFEQLRDEMQDRKTTGFKDYTMSAKRLGELRQLGLSAYKAPLSSAQEAFSKANRTLDRNLNNPESYRGARSSGRFRRYAEGDLVRDPKDTLQKYFEKPSYLRAGERHKGMLRSAGRKEQADRKKDMKKLETPAPPVLYNSLSRAGFDSMAMQVGLNKNPKFPPGTKYFDQEKYYDQEVAKISGRTFKLRDYLSTSANNNKAKLFLDNAKRNKDGWASFMKILTKPKAKAVNVVEQLAGRKVGGVKTDKVTGQTLYQKPPESEEEFILRSNSRFKINSARFHRPGTNKNIWMDVQQFANGGSLYKDNKNKRAGYDPKKLAAFLGAPPVTTDKQKKLADMLNDGKIEKPNYEELLKKSRGYAQGGEIPIMAKEGEYVINKNSAQDIGYDNLARFNKGGLTALNQLPKYHSGGIIQRLNKGGTVSPQRLAFGGGVSARPGDNANINNLMVPSESVNQLRLMITALEELGVTSSRSADLIRKGGRASVQAANAAYEADIVRLRIAGAPMQTVIQAETQLANMRRQADRQVVAQRQLSGVSGERLQRIDTGAQDYIQRKIASRQARGEDISEDDMMRIQNRGYRREAKRQGLSPTQMAGLSGNDVRQFITSAMGDPKTFEAMNRSFEANRRKEILTQINAERGVTNDRKEIANRSKEARRLAREESDARRQILNQTRGAAGPGPTRSERLSQGMFGASFVLPMAAQMLAGDPSKAESASAARSSAAIQGAANTFSVGAMMTSMIPPGLPQTFALLATSAAAVGQAFIDAKNAAIEFEKNLANKKIESALEKTGMLFEKLSKDLSNVDIQKQITDRLIEANDAAIRSIDIQAKTAKAFWINFIDAFANDGMAAAQRSQIAEKYGTSAYFDTTAFGQNPLKMMANATSGTLLERMGMVDFKDEQNRADLNRTEYANRMMPEQARDISKQFSPIAENAIRLIEEKIKGGTKIEDILSADDFDKLSRSIAMANVTIAEQVLSVRNSLVLTDAQKKAQEELIVQTYAESEAKKRASIVSREIEMREARKATSKLSRSLERMFQNMEHSINATNFALEKMTRDLDLASASLQGQAKLGESSLNSINVLQNPKAYSSREFDTATNQASGFFGNNGGIVKGLLTLGNDIESTVMGTINKTISNSKDPDNQEKLAIEIEKAVKSKLAELELPDDISEKLAREVKASLDQLRKEGDQKIDFSQLEERIQDLSKVFDSAKKAQDIAIKALENWDNALNSFTKSMNTLVDLEVEYQSKLRRSHELQIGAQTELSKSLGKELSIRDVINNRNSIVGAQTGGATSPENVSNNINMLEERRRQQEAGSDVARQQGPAAVKDFEKFQRNLVNTNVALRENYDALKSLAENSDVASAALGKIQEAQQRQQGRVGFIEKLVTSTPEEFESLNRAFFRLQRNIDGQLNTINTSVGAQKAYNEAISGGANAMQAMRAAQSAFANERKETVSALSDLLPFLGSGQTANSARANTLEAMLKESNMGVSPMMQEVLNSLRNPEADPETKQAIQLYNEANNLQIKANESLAEISKRMQTETSDKAAKAIADALTSTILTFKLADQKDLNKGLVPQGKAYGGIIYASAGTFAAKGTDTVPAMLTPGEFVINKNATAKNLPLLRSINNNHYSSGGKVRYYAGGGYVSSLLAANAMDEDDFKQSKEEFVKLDSDRIKELVSNNSKLYKMPNIYLQASDGARGQTPDKTSFADQSQWGTGRDFRPAAGRRKAGIYDFTQIYDAQSNGEILPGYVETGFKINSGYYGGYPENTKLDFARNTLTEPIPIDVNNIVLGLTKDKRDIPLDTEPYKAQKFDFYREKAKELKLQELANKISWAENPNNFQIGREILSAADYPTTINPVSNTKSKLIPHGLSDSVLFASQDNLAARPKYSEYATIWANKSAMRKAFAVTTGKNPPEFSDALAGGEQFAQYRSMRSVVYEKPTDGLINKGDRNDIITYNKTQYEAIKTTIEAINQLNNLDMVESTDSSLYKKVQESLSNLYNNKTISETFEGNQMSLFPSLLDDKSLSVVAGDNESRQSILKFIEAQIVGLKAGDKPKLGAEDIKIGISKIPPVFNRDLLKGWVEEREFDIDDPKKSGVKRFPYLVNLSPSDISDTFTEKAKEAAGRAAVAGPVTTSIVPYNGQLAINAGGGKSIDLPYSAIYTKYNGPLWDEKIRGFSNKKLKDMYLANDAKDTIFSSLDTGTHALAAKKELDLNDRRWTSLNYPVQSVGKLLDLYKEDKPDQNLIDKEIAQLKGSTIDVAHDNAPFGKMVGSLIKSQGGAMMGGADLFSGWSNINNTSFGFGDFLVEALNKYAKNNKGEAKKVVGKSADDKFAQDTLANNPTEFVKALKAVTLGSLNIFGRRQIPGVSGSWFAKNGGARAFALLRNNRVNMQQGKSMSGFLMNAISNAGAYVSNISSRVTDPRLYDNLKDLYTIMSGGYEAYKGFSTFNTKSIVQLLKNSVDAFGNFAPTPQTIEDMFRSLGASASFAGASSQELPEDYKAILGDQLQGSKIRTVDSSGRITDVAPANIKYKNYDDLMNLAINPYNEYTSRDIRGGIISRLMNDISSAKDPRGRAFFDPRTQGFLLNSLGSLQKWYGGNGKWLGQDYLYDKQANPDPKDRADKFQDSLSAAVDVWSEANTAHRNLGAAAKFGGDLPNSNWFKTRIEAGNFATGGMVYASGGTLVNFQPRGTDTVPAMLTPGEFVINRSATQKHLPLLKQINSNKYLASGGLLGKPRVVQGVTLEPEDTLTPKIDNILKTTTSHSSTLISINKNIQELDDRFKNSSNTLMTRMDKQGEKLGSLGQNANNKLNELGTIISTIPQMLDNIFGSTTASDGGLIYASQGRLVPYAPKGTDTVPAMLTPGEFVVNRAATSKNLPLLQNINSGNYSTGGMVNTMYYAKGTGRPVPSATKKPGFFSRVFGGGAKKPTGSSSSPDFSKIPHSLMEKHGFATGSKPRSPEMQNKLDKLLKSSSGSKSNPDETVMMKLMKMAGMGDANSSVEQDLFLKQITDRDIELINSRNADQVWRIRKQAEWTPGAGLIDDTWFSRLTRDYLDAGFTEDQLISQLGGPATIRRLGQEGGNEALIRKSLYKTVAAPKVNQIDEEITKALSDKHTKTESLEKEIARLTGSSDSVGAVGKDGMAGTLEGLKAQKLSLEQQIDAMYTEARIRTGKSVLSGADKKKADEIRKVLNQIEDYKTKKGKMSSLQETLGQKKTELERLQLVSPGDDLTVQTLSRQKEQYQKLESLTPPPPVVPAQGFRKGGVVYAQDGTAIPPEKWAVPAAPTNLSLDELEGRVVYGNKVLEENDIKYLRDTYLNNNGGTENKNRAYSVLMHSADNEFASLNLDDSLRSSIDTYMKTGKQPDVKMSDAGIPSREDSMRDGAKSVDTYFRPEWADNKASASANNRGLKEYPKELLQIEEQVNSSLSAVGKPASWRLPDSLLQAYSEKNEKLLNLQLDQQYADAPLQAMVIGASKAIAPSLAAIGAGSAAATGGLGALPTIGLSIIAGQVASWLQESMLNKISREKNEEWNIISDRNRFASLAGSTAGGMLATTAALGPNSFRAIGTQTIQENLLSRAATGGTGAAIDFGLQKGLGLMVGQTETDWNSVLLSAIAGGVQPTMGAPSGGLIGALSKHMDGNIASSRSNSLENYTGNFGEIIAGSPTASKTIQSLVASMDPKAIRTADPTNVPKTGAPIPKGTGVGSAKDDFIAKRTKEIEAEYEREYRSNKDYPGALKYVEDRKKTLLDNVELEWKIQEELKGNSEVSKMRYGNTPFRLTSQDLPRTAPARSYDELVAEIQALSGTQLESLLQNGSRLGSGANRDVYQLTDSLAFSTYKGASLQRLLEKELKINLTESNRAAFESKFGGTIASVTDTEGSPVGGILARIQGVTKTDDPSSSLDVLSKISQYDDNVLFKLFADQHELAKRGYGKGLSDSKVQNMIFGDDSITPIDMEIGEPIGYFPTGRPFTQFMDANPDNTSLSRVILEDSWMRAMSTLPSQLRHRGIDEIIQNNPKAFLDRIEGFKYLQSESDPAANTPDILGKTAYAVLRKIEDDFKKKVSSAHGRFKQTMTDTPVDALPKSMGVDSSSLPPPGSKTSVGLGDSPKRTDRIDSGGFMRNVTMGLQQFFGGSKKQSVTGLYDRVSRQLASDGKLSPELSIGGLRKTLGTEAEKHSIPKTLADFARIMGLPLDKVAPKDLEAVFDPNYEFGGSYGSSRLIMKSRQYPNILQLLGRSAKVLSSGKKVNDQSVGMSEGMKGDVVWHEATHMLFKQLEDTQYSAFQKKMKDNMDPILGYMGSRPDIFQGYDQADVGGAFYYLTRLITGKSVHRSQNRSTKLMEEANASRLKDDLPLTPEQKTRVDQYRKAHEQWTKSDRKSPPPIEGFESVDIPNFPPVLMEDIIPAGSKYTLSPNSYAAKSSSLMKDVLDAGLVASQGKGPDLDPISAKLIASFDTIEPADVQSQIGWAREEFVTQMMQNLDVMDGKGLTILTELFEASFLKDPNVFDGDAFYQRVSKVLNQRKDAPEIYPRPMNQEVLSKAAGGLITPHYYAGGSGRRVPPPKGRNYQGGRPPAPGWVMQDGLWVAPRFQRAPPIPEVPVSPPKKGFGARMSDFVGKTLGSIGLGSSKAAAPKSTIDDPSYYYEDKGYGYGPLSLYDLESKFRTGSLNRFTKVTSNKLAAGKFPSNAPIEWTQLIDFLDKHPLANDLADRQDRFRQPDGYGSSSVPPPIPPRQTAQKSGSSVPPPIPPRQTAQKSGSSVPPPIPPRQTAQKSGSSVPPKSSQDQAAASARAEATARAKAETDARARARAEAETRARAEEEKKRRTQEQRDSWTRSSRPRSSSMPQLDAAYQFFGIQGIKTGDAKAFLEAYRSFAKKNHPDIATDKDAASVAMKQANVYKTMIQRAWEAEGFAQKLSRGGMVYASEGQLIDFKPRGTDTVPAMLTPGEFVVNAKATAQHLPLLRSINKSKGGKINYLAAGGQPFAGDQDKDYKDGMARDGIKDRMIRGQALINQRQVKEAQANRAGQLWVFEDNNIQRKEDKTKETPQDKTKRAEELKGNDTNVRLLMKDFRKRPRGKEFNERPLTSISLEKSDIYTTRASNDAKAKKNIFDDFDDGLPIPQVRPVTAQSVLSKAKAELSRRSIGRRLLEWLSYQLDTSPKNFEIMNADMYNEDVDVDKKVKDIADTIIGWKNNPGLMTLEGPKTSRQYGDIVNRHNDIQTVYKNASQALAIIKKEQLEGTNDYPSFKTKTVGEILKVQTDSQIAEGLSARSIIDRLKNHNDEYVRKTINDPRFVAGAGILPASSWGQVDASHFEGTDRVPVKSKKLNHGGIVYASEGTLVNYQPRGTDTVPAMLTPGEFVVNRSATQKNLSLLHAINAGAYSRGGVAYLQTGGVPSGQTGQTGQNSNLLAVVTSGFVQALDLAVKALREYQQQLSETKPNSVSNNTQLTGLDGLGQFVTKFDSFIQSLSKLNLPPIISLQVAPITLNITGGEALKQALEGPMSATLRKEIDDAFARLSAATEGALRT